jgi:fused signal recognition particle receptor
MDKENNFLKGLFGRKHTGASADHPDDNSAKPPAADLPSTERADVQALSGDNVAPENKGFLARLRTGLTRTSQRLSQGVASIVNKRPLDAEALEDLEELLISADLGVAAAGRVIESLSKERFDKQVTDAEVASALAKEVAATLAPHQKPLVIDEAHRPHVILVTGVNGAGKTTTIGKMAAQFRKQGRTVMLAAGDTFRAAAVEQLVIWGQRTGVEVVSRPAGADAAGLAFEAFERARDKGVDILMIDTAGRLQNRKELMDELAKIVRVLRKIDPSAPHDTLLVLDATVGQNAISQADSFREIAGVTGLVMTKLDGTARGGVLVALADRHQLPIHYIGVGEQIEDLQPFDAASFADALAGLSSLSGRS